jgi:hypothetical protein
MAFSASGEYFVHSCILMHIQKHVGHSWSHNHNESSKITQHFRVACASQLLITYIRWVTTPACFNHFTFLFDSLLHTLPKAWMYVSLSGCMSHCPVPSTSSKDFVALYLKENTCRAHVIFYHICWV